MVNSLSHSKAKGDAGESVACRFIRRNGFSVITRNYRKKWGEIDIVAEKGSDLHFFEVKSSTSALPGCADSHRPEENVHPFKVRQIRRMIGTYFAEHEVDADRGFHFHVLSVHMDMRSRKAKIKWLKDVIL